MQDAARTALPTSAITADFGDRPFGLVAKERETVNIELCLDLDLTEGG